MSNSMAFDGSSSDSDTELPTIPIIQSPHQLEKLEFLFLGCQCPSKAMREQWSLELGMEPHQIKNWFKNKMLFIKAQEERDENDVLRLENARIRFENMQMSRQLMHPSPCSNCERNQVLEELLFENATLKEEHQTVSNILFTILEDPERFENLMNKDDSDPDPDIDLELRLAPPASPASSPASDNQSDD